MHDVEVAFEASIESYLHLMHHMNTFVMREHLAGSSIPPLSLPSCLACFTAHPTTLPSPKQLVLAGLVQAAQQA